MSERPDRYRHPQVLIDFLQAEARALEADRDRLRKALAAYRSALRSGEPESDQLREFGDAALTEQSEGG